MFLSLMYVRVPESKKRTEESYEKIIKRLSGMWFSNKEWVKRALKETNQSLSEKETEEVIKFAQDGSRYNIKFPSNVWLSSMMEMSLEIERIFSTMDWDIKYHDVDSLITSDNPMILLPPKDYSKNCFYGVGLITPGAKKIIALTSSVCLIMHDLNKNAVIEYSESSIKDAYEIIKLNTAVNSDRFVYASDKNELEKIVRDTKIDSYIKKERVIVS